MKKVKSIGYDEITQDEWEYTDEFKKALDKRYSNYNSGGKVFTSDDAERQIDDILKRGKK